MSKSFRLCIALVVLCGLATPTQAQDPEGAGRIVFVDLPSGATVRAGELERTFEEDAQGRPYILYPVGVARVTVEVLGERPVHTRVEVVEGGETEVTYREVRVSSMGAARAMALPGSLQLLEGRPLVGAAVVAGMAASVGGVFWANGNLVEARQAADAAEMHYDLAMTEAAAVAAREAHASAISDAEGARTTAFAFVAVGLTVYAVSVIDAFRHHTRGAALTISPPQHPIVALRPTGTGVALQIRL